FAAIGTFNAHRTRLDASDQRRVAGQDTQLAGLTGQGHKLGLAGEDRRFRADDIYVNGCHFGSSLYSPCSWRPATRTAATSASGRGARQTDYSFLAFSKASSIEPTM